MARLAKCDVVSIEDLTIAEVERIFALADQCSESLNRGENLDLARGLIMATLFYEPSTRTRLSFESAMHHLGGSVISSADMHASSAAKGESLADTARVVSAYADLIVVRHPHDGAARVAAEYAPCPILNAGDGSREHPTQTLCDLYILRKKKGRLKGLTIAICGDLKYGRTVHSLIYALARFGANILAVPNQGLNVPDYVLDRLAAERGYNFSTVGIDELRSLAGGLDALYLTPSAPHQMALFTQDMPLKTLPSEKAPAALDAFYVTRLQRERRAENEGDQGGYVRFDAQALKTSRTHEAMVMHPLPRTDELAWELDADPRAVYFEQAAAGVPVRMALIVWLIENSTAVAPRADHGEPPIRFKSEPAPRCANPNCIIRHEGAYLRPRFRLVPHVNRSVLLLRCDFCDRELKVEFVGHARSRRYYRFDESLYGYVRRWIKPSPPPLLRRITMYTSSCTLSTVLSRSRPLRYSINVTLDGCCDHRAFSTDEDLHRHTVENLNQADALLFGGVTYEMMESAWRPPAPTGARPDWMETFAQTINVAKKYVVSSTLEQVDWNTEFVHGDVGKAVQQLKRESGDGLFVGGVKLPRTLTELGLIDEYEFVVHPKLAGHGPTLLAGLSQHVDLKLVSRLEFGSGAVVMRYEPRR